jgi:Ser/Thr protein kinase RdoA (MazF antagonist)
MGQSLVREETVATYLATILAADVQVLAIRALKDAEPRADDPKGFGYGVPLEVECLVDGHPRAYVLSRTRPAHGFGHDYPADRAWQALYGHGAYNTFPRHARSVDVGLLRSSGELVSAADAVEFFQIVEKADGALYWLDLERLLEAPLRELDVARAEALARFLAEAHAVKHDDAAIYHRRIRELVGHGECLMGILDSYPHPYPPLPATLCEALETAAVTWRWRLRGRTHRLSRVHGDFHPWNLLFREGVDFTVLDRSRGEWGEPADDVAALGINYLFYGLRAKSVAPFDFLFRTFLGVYLRESRDQEVLDVLPPFFAFRALVLAHPRWYPALAPKTRAALVRFAGRMMADTRFDPTDLAAIFGEAR